MDGIEEIFFEDQRNSLELSSKNNALILYIFER